MAEDMADLVKENQKLKLMIVDEACISGLLITRLLALGDSREEIEAAIKTQRVAEHIDA